MSYESPELVEIGNADELTLGTNGTCNDKCECSVHNTEEEAPQ